MKLRWDRIDVSEAQERELESAVRSLANKETDATSSPSQVYFANLIVKTNERIDYITSGKALSISWLARVAVPGVVAILFFFIGLHYYKPETNGRNSVVDAVSALPETVVDSMVVSSLVENGTSAIAGLRADAFDVSRDQLAEYCINSETVSTLLETIPEHNLDDIASILEMKTTNL